MKRNNYDKSHLAYVAGDIGRLQTIACIPCVAGDTVSLDVQAVMRLSALRRNLVLDAQVDFFAFYVKHRQIYGSDWSDFINDGVDETITLTAGPVIGNYWYLGWGTPASGPNLALWNLAGYNRIWNRYFRNPTDASSVRADTAVESTVRGTKYGALCARLKRPWSTGIDGGPVAADREVVPVGSNIDVVDFEQIRMRYKTETERAFFARRYTDVLRQFWGGSASTDADERPTLLMRKTSTLSGYDVDGTDDASLGSFSGKSAAMLGMRMPPKLMSEHGALWVMCLVRFPSVIDTEFPFLMQKPNPTYKEIAGDPDIIMAEPPIDMNLDEWMLNGTATSLGIVPFGQWYRTHPNFVHPTYHALTGFPFTGSAPTTKVKARYHFDAEYDDAFQSQQLAQWQFNGHVGCHVKSVVPPAVTSIFAGTR